MHTFFRSLRAGISHTMGKISRWVREHQALSLVYILVLCLLVVPQTGHTWSLLGIDTADVGRYAFELIIWIISAIVQFLGHMFVYLVDIFLGFARYNGFADAQPVKLGWVIVRDICNMFFIVVLLISAFSTIIPWDPSLRYNTVVPKLLLMAILINFSRTLIQVLIDFSQVVMLTFVNAFRAAGAGNFMSAFRIDRLLSMKDDVDSALQRTAGITNIDENHFDMMVQIFASFLLALVLVVIANGVMIIMVAFILARIVGLWVALIFSPIAFFVTALPARLQSSLSSFSGKYWQRLGGMLTGGPVVMFFIYLTFAILQTPVTPAVATPAATPAGQTPAATPTTGGTGLAAQLDMYHPTEEINGAGVNQFLTNVGTSDDVASFIVAVALMLMALEAAVEAANAVDSTVGKFATTVGSASKGLAFGAAALAASSPWIASKFLGRGIDKRYDLTGKASTVGLWATNKIPILGKYARKPLMAGMMMRKRERMAEDAEYTKDTAGMTPDQERLAQAGLRSIPGAIVGGVADKVTGVVGGGLQKASNWAQRKGGAAGFVGGKVFSGLSRAVEATNEGLGRAWFTQGEQQMLMSSAGRLASAKTAGADQRELEKIEEGKVNRDVRYSHLSQQERDDIAENRAADIVQQRTSEQLSIQETVGKYGHIRSHADIDAVKAEAKKNPLLWAKESKKDSRSKKLFEQPKGLTELNPDAKRNMELATRGLRGVGVLETNEETGMITVTQDKARLEKVLADIGKVDADYEETIRDLLKFVEHSTTDVDGVEQKGLSFDALSQLRVELDTDNNKRMVENPRAGKTFLGKGADFVKEKTGIELPMGAIAPISLWGEGSASRLAVAAHPDTPGDRRVRRSTDEAAAIAELGKFSKAGQMGTEDAGKQIEKFLAAGGKIADILYSVDAKTGDESGIKGSELALQQFVAAQTRQVGAISQLSGKEGQLELAGATDEERTNNARTLQVIIRKMRPYLEQMDGRLGQQGLEQALGAVSKARMNVEGIDDHGAARPGQSMSIAEVWGSSKMIKSISDKLDRKAGVSLYAAAELARSFEEITKENYDALNEITRRTNDRLASPLSVINREASNEAKLGVQAGASGGAR